MLAALFAATAVITLAAALRQPLADRGPRNIARLSTLDARELRTLAGSTMPLWERIFLPLVHNLSQRLTPRWSGLSQDDLRQAGIDSQRFSLADLMAVKVISSAMAALIVMLASALFSSAVVLLPAAAFGAYMAPSLVIRKRKTNRRRQLLSELPDFVGLLKAFVSAGLSLEQALNLISSQQAAGTSTNLLAREMRTALSDYGLGMSIEASLASMADRLGIEELQLFCAGLSQGKHLGAGMTRILRDQEAVIRLQQRNRVTAEASRVSTRLVGILVLVYLPEFMLLIMVPLFYGIFLKAFS